MEELKRYTILPALIEEEEDLDTDSAIESPVCDPDCDMYEDDACSLNLSVDSDISDGYEAMPMPGPKCPAKHSTKPVTVALVVVEGQ